MNENDPQVHRPVEKMSEKELLLERDRIEESLKSRRWRQTGAMVVGLIGAVAAGVTGRGYLFPLFGLVALFGGEFLELFLPKFLHQDDTDEFELQRLRIVERSLQKTLRAKSPSDRSYTPPSVQGGPAATA